MTTNENRIDERSLKDEKRKNKDMFWNKLNLSSDQSISFKKLGMQYFDSCRKLRKVRDSLTLQISNELKKAKPDSTRISNLTLQMGANYTKNKNWAVHHILNMKGLCSAKQIQYLDSMYFFMLIGSENSPQHRHGEHRKDSTQIKNKKQNNTPAPPPPPQL